MAEPRTTRHFLIAIAIGPDQAEHADLLNALKSCSDGEFRSMRFGEGSRARLVLLPSKLRPDEIAGAFAQILLNDDQYLIVEIGPDWWTSENLSAAKNWLNARVSRR